MQHTVEILDDYVSLFLPTHKGNTFFEGNYWYVFCGVEMDKITKSTPQKHWLCKESGLAASAINNKGHKYDEYREGEERTQGNKVSCKVMSRNTVPSQYTGTPHRLQAGIWYPVST